MQCGVMENRFMVSTVNETFFSHLEWKDCKWLSLKFANGLDMLHTGYSKLYVMVLGQCIPGRGILIIEDPDDPVFQSRKGSKAGVEPCCGCVQRNTH